ncbi:hypothetical protein NC653_035512 [Populus alba x Populus x berolinensis]|uniref:ABC1 atypical kinase-like domain-containing protein n=1 Tax=Populus alba x Populus x berolinensis TaxID=444605 RepID=A0AAD6LQ58_9ROSI|nr:hypothetical protein NC653_035512 [Populus alba x Populus x berolinensis]
MQGKQLKSEHSQPIEQICEPIKSGLPLDSIFSSISPPITAASLGQVYKAHLTHSGQIVDAEVQQRLGTKGIPDRLLISRCNALVPKKLLDLTFTGFFINKYVDFIASNVVALIDEFSSRVYQELNYVQVVSFIIRAISIIALHHHFRN